MAADDEPSLQESRIDHLIYSESGLKDNTLDHNLLAYGISKYLFQRKLVRNAA